MASIRTNLQAGLISRQLSNINRRFTTNLERLSTGLRLNRPDDSPGQYGVVINQNLQIQSLNQGVLNAQNAAGMLQTAEEGINTLIDVLNRAHDLAVTAADATLTQAQRQQAQDEVERLLTASDGSAEIQQLLDNVNYNGVKLLSDSEKSAAVQGAALGAAGGKRDTTRMGGDRVTLATITGGSTTASLFVEYATASGTGGVLNAGTTKANNFDAITAADLTSVGLVTSKSGMVINMSSIGTNIEKGDVIELALTGSSGQTTSDQVIVADIVNDRHSGVSSSGAADVTVFNAQGHTVALNLYDTLITDGITTTTDTFTIKRIPQTLILDSTGANATSASSRNFDPGTIATTSNTDSEFREIMHVGVALKASGDSSSAALNRVTISFADTNPLVAAQKIQAAIEDQLGGEYRAGGALHIDVTAVADVYKIADIDITKGGDTTNSVLIGTKAEVTQDLWTSTKNVIGTGAYTSFNGTTYMDQIGREYVDASKVFFKLSSTSTAGVNLTPELRLMSDELAGYTSSTYPDRLFGNSLSISTGEHGNDKFMLTIDGEEVEVDMDGDFASSTNSRISTLVSAAETYTINASNTTAALTQSTFRVGISDGNTIAGVAISENAAAFDVATTGESGLNYAMGLGTSRDYTGGYYSQDNLRTMLTDAINKATTAAKDASVSYDQATRTFTLTTGSRSNQSSLNIGKSVASNITLGDGTTKATSLVDTTPGTSGFIGALGMSEGANNAGTGSFFEFRLGGAGDTFAINFGTFGVTNMGADQIDISNITLSTQSGAATAISVIEQALDSISTTQTRIGAGINHMQRRVNVMESHREALRGAKARIEEIDFTVETRNLASLQILLQSSTAALAQANIIPQTLLQLLA
jgi:flagellin